MTQQLWSVDIGEAPLAVVAAACRNDAWRMAAILANHDDLPSARWSDFVIRLCSPVRAASLHKRAEKLGIKAGFLAFLQNGTFLTYIAGREMKPAEKIAEWAA